jgi:hypothetical protein
MRPTSGRRYPSSISLACLCEWANCWSIPSRTYSRPGWGVEDIRPLFSIDYGPRLYYCSPFVPQRCVPVFRVTQEPRDLLRPSESWLSAVSHRPGAYLAHRGAFAHELLRMNRDRQIYYLGPGPKHPLAERCPVPTRTLALLASSTGKRTRSTSRPGSICSRARFSCRCTAPRWTRGIVPRSPRDSRRGTRRGEAAPRGPVVSGAGLVSGGGRLGRGEARTTRWRAYGRAVA